MSIRNVLPCLALCLWSTGLAAQVKPTEADRVGLDELNRGHNAAAIQEIMANDGLATDDPARNINLGVAHAREGRFDEARAHFRAALLSTDRAALQTARGEWVDSRELARRGLRKLAMGTFTGEQLASSR